MGILGQARPGATETLVYAPKPGKRATVTSFIACNRDATTQKFRARVARVGVTLNLEQYVFYDIEVPTRDSFIAVGGGADGVFKLEENEGIHIEADNDMMSFSVFGEEEEVPQTE